MSFLIKRRCRVFGEAVFHMEIPIDQIIVRFRNLFRMRHKKRRSVGVLTGQIYSSSLHGLRR
jgi:hypothetical protein